MLLSKRISKRARIVSIAPLLAAALLGCVAQSDSVSGNQTSSDNQVGKSNIHYMPVMPGQKGGPRIKMSAPAGAELTYYGGPVISNVRVWTVFWGSGVPNQSKLNAFYSTVTSSAYFDWLGEYDTPTQHIGRGSLAGSVVDTGAPAGATVTDSQVQSEITRLIKAGTLPPNDANNIYMVYFPPGVSITSGTSQSCVEFCAYHGTFTLGGGNAYYGVLPDLGGSCAGACGAGDQFQNTTSVSSHELVEAVTDAAVGLATTVGPPLAWYDQTNGEIGDICNAEQAVVDGFTVQKEFSNQAQDCIATKGAGGGGGAGAGGAGGAGAGGAGAGGTGAGGTGAGGTGAGGTGGGGTCSHPLCSTGSKLKASCDPCVETVCAQDAHCCDVGWNKQCVSEMTALCGETCPSSGTCSHAVCFPGGKLSPSCDPCVADICAQDPRCCSTGWNAQCVAEVTSVCGESCN